MKVRIKTRRHGIRFYDSHSTPLMLILTQHEKQLIADMAPEATKFLSYPETMTEEAASGFMDDAFPEPPATQEMDLDELERQLNIEGARMAIRDRFAAAALQPLIAIKPYSEQAAIESLATCAYEIADAMMATRTTTPDGVERT